MGRIARRLVLTTGVLALVGGYLSEDPGPTRNASHRPEPPRPTTYPAVPAPSACAVAPTPYDADGEPQRQLSCTEPHIALTIDDGPDPVWTPKILSLLHRYRIPATFFMVGSSVAANPHITAAVHEGGHQIGNHTFSHPLPLTAQSPTRIRAEILRASDTIAAACGHYPNLFRAPGGLWSPAVLATCAEAGMRPVAWSVDTMDWARPGTDQIVNTLLTQTRPGSIILDHDGAGDQYQTLTALAIALPRLVDAGYHFTHL